MEKKKGEGKQRFKKKGKAGLRRGCPKEGKAGTSLQTMNSVLDVKRSFCFFANLC